MKVAVIQGGPSAEAEVSRASAAGVANALREAGHDPERLELDASLGQRCMDGGYDVAFPATHGRLGEDGCLQGMLELIGLPYVGSGVLSSALAMHKVFAKKAFRDAHLPVAADIVVHASDDLAQAPERVRAALGPAVVVKPSTEGSAIGVTRITAEHSNDELRAAMQQALAYDDAVLCERYVLGQEVTCAVVDAPSLGELRALPVTEIISRANTWYDFTSRYAPGGSVHRCPASLPPRVTARVQQIAVRAHQALGCRDLSRVDFVVGDGPRAGAVTLLEVNTLPGMTATSLFPEAASAGGISFPRLCDALVVAAAARSGARRHVSAVPMPGRGGSI